MKNKNLRTAKQITTFYEVGLIDEIEYTRLLSTNDDTGKMLRSLLV
ncbi:hypothetical protein HN958_02645 [Candidatus Falkowbacteria bacterium]|jgi:hypothetical protein|nr:hypothetical protein [Candidatus Falkowbacteria bacterium]